MRVNGRGHGHDDRPGLTQKLRISGKAHCASRKLFPAGLAGTILAGGKAGDSGLVDVKAHNIAMAGKGHGQRQPHIAESHHRHRVTAFLKIMKRGKIDGHVFSPG